MLIEGYTYRLGAHTTAGDSKLYRDESQVAAWLSKDPSLEDTFGHTFSSLPPQVAILGLGRVHETAVDREGRLAVASILPLSLVFDHRVCDGAYALGFVNYFMELVSDPIRMLL